MRRVSRQIIGVARFTGLIFILCLYGKRAGLHRTDFHVVFIWQMDWFSARLQVILCKIIRKSENQPGLGLKSFMLHFV